MLASQRKQQILQILAEEKQVMSGDLSQRFSVSEDSIRRDLRELAAEGKLQRVHGGALPVSKPSRLLKQERTCKSPQSRPLPSARLSSFSPVRW
jgi:DeoR/GlpR family transcriptional regulator of sugar metabolism